MVPTVLAVAVLAVMAGERPELSNPAHAAPGLLVGTAYPQHAAAGHVAAAKPAVRAATHTSVG